MRWIKVSGFGGFYEVSDNGLVRSFFKNKWGRLKVPRILALSTTPKGYKMVTLKYNGLRRGVHVSRLMLESFHGFKTGMVCRHLNGDPSDNRLSNLKWGTPKENSHDMRTHGTIQLGEKNPHSKLKEVHVIEIRNLVKSGLSQRKTAKQFNVSHGTVQRIIGGLTWTHI